MPRLVRRAPWSERIKALLDPCDFLLWLSEELNDDAYEETLRAWSLPIGVALNVVFVLCKSTSRPYPGERDDVFGEARSNSGSGWLSWLAFFIVQLLTVLICVNALYTFLRVRHYRLFEQAIDEPPATPSARRVRVDSSPASPSPYQYVQHIFANVAAERAYPDAEREVWQVSVWDPKPFNLTLFTLFSPGHILLYWALLPPAALDPRPSVTVLTAFFFGFLLSMQLVILKSSFSQQSKDNALIHGEVMNEYDTKFVHPSLNRIVRDVGVQTRTSTASTRGHRTREVDVYTPTTIIKRGFRTNPNPNYARQYDPDNLMGQRDVPSRLSLDTPTALTPTTAYTNAFTQSVPSSSRRESSAGPDFSSPLKPHHERPREHRASTTGYAHVASPLRKTVSSNDIRPEQQGGERRLASPLKRVQMAGDGVGRRRESGRF